MQSECSTGNASRTHDGDARRGAWMAAVQRGDRVAYDALLRECIPLVRRVARRCRVPADNVDDVVQDTLLAMHRVRHTFDPRRSFDAWLGSIARRRAIDSFRRSQHTAAHEVHGRSEDEASTHSDSAAVAALEWRATLRVVREAVMGLPPAQREAVELLTLGECRSDDAAHLTGRSAVSHRVNLHRAIKALRSRLKDKV
jgi:RNA polymerase sigma factor (sigma-70 family)